MTLNDLARYACDHPEVRTLLIPPATFIDFLLMVHPAERTTHRDESGEYFLFHWLIVRPNIGFTVYEEPVI